MIFTLVFLLLAVVCLIWAGYACAEEDNTYTVLFIVGLFGIVMLAANSYDMAMEEQRELITECQKELPRNVSCKIIAVEMEE